MVDEIELIAEEARERGVPEPGPGAITRVETAIADGRTVSALRWGPAEPEVVFLHGGAQNAHTWDSVAVLFGRPLLAIDLPGHGRSSWRDVLRYDPAEMAEDVATVWRAHAPKARHIVGMSLGGLTTIALAARSPELVDRAVVVDVTPGVRRDRPQRRPDDRTMIHGQESYATFDEMLAHTMRFRPTRTERSLWRALHYNARQRDDGRWVWRHHLGNSPEPMKADFSYLWDDLSGVRAALMLVIGDRSNVVLLEDVTRVRELQPEIRIEVVAGAGHAVQSDRPAELVALLTDFLGPAV